MLNERYVTGPWSIPDVSLLEAGTEYTDISDCLLVYPWTTCPRSLPRIVPMGCSILLLPDQGISKGGPLVTESSVYHHDYSFLLSQVR